MANNKESSWIDNNLITDGGYLKIFHKIGVIGDSLSSGEQEFVDSDGLHHYLDLYDYSWLSTICRATGSRCAHYSEGGLTTESWYNGRFHGYLENEPEKCTAYFIALCTNDFLNKSYPIGTIEDCGTDNRTFFAFYSKIIELVKSVQPNAKLFLISAYFRGKDEEIYSAAIKELADKYKNCYYIDLIGLGSDLGEDERFMGVTHFNTLGYVRVAKEIATITNKVILDNWKDFADVSYIGTTFEKYIGK